MDASVPSVRPVNGLSHVKGPTERPLLEATIPAFLAEVVRRHGERPAAVFQSNGDRWSFQEFSDKVDQLAAGLLALGLYKGDRVGIWSPNRPEWLLAQFATARIGVILVNINPAYQRSELEYALNKTGAKAILAATRFKSSEYIQMLQELAPELADCRPGQLQSARLPHLRIVVQLGEGPVPGCFHFDQVMDKGTSGGIARLDAITTALSHHDPINIQFTSGTTGAPKGATLTHYNILNNGISVARAMKLQPGEALCIPVPFYHCFGMVLGNLAAIAYGVKMVFPGEGFDPLETLTALETERCNGVHGVPIMFQAMLDHPEFKRFNLRGLRTGIMAGAPCPVPLMRRVIDEMHCDQMTIAYGMTETSPVSFQTSVDDSLEHKVSSVGTIQPHVEVRVVNASGDTLPIGEQGELLTKGYLVMQGYWDDPERTTEAIRDGWMHTGDLGVIDHDGFCKVTGRIKDMLIRGGENIYPAEIENFLMTHQDISAAQVFGVPDPKFGEEACAWIVSRDPGLNSQAVLDFCRGQIAHFKVPRYIRFVEEFPMTVTGKPQKFVMRDR
ncbi:MAG: AMP-binding protein, partial [Pseudomonadota bacterium]